MKTAVYGTLPIGTRFKINGGGASEFVKGDGVDFFANEIVKAEMDTSVVILADEPPSPESIDFRRHAVFKLVSDELDAARQNHPSMHSHHEAYSILLEEVEEFWDEVKLKESKRDKARTRAELVQVAAMAIRAIIDLDLL